MSFTTNRTYTLKVDKIATKYSFSPLSGTPQGSHSGPLIFLIYINDLPSVINTAECLLYADDTKLFKKINSIQNCHELQWEINSLSLWAQKNKLILNPAKSVSLSFCKTTPKYAFQYTLNNQSLNSVESHVDLGLTMDAKLNFHYHTNKTSKRCL